MQTEEPKAEDLSAKQFHFSSEQRAPLRVPTTSGRKKLHEDGVKVLNPGVIAAFPMEKLSFYFKHV